MFTTNNEVVLQLLAYYSLAYNIQQMKFYHEESEAQ